MPDFSATVNEAKDLLKRSNQHFIKILAHGSLEVEYFAPSIADTQLPHSRDELYIIIKGTAVLKREDKYISCAVNDVLFIPAGMHHRFEKFTDDFATWVIFYGPEGGEQD